MPGAQGRGPGGAPRGPQNEPWWRRAVPQGTSTRGGPHSGGHGIGHTAVGVAAGLRLRRAVLANAGEQGAMGTRSGAAAQRGVLWSSAPQTPGRRPSVSSTLWVRGGGCWRPRECHGYRQEGVGGVPCSPPSPARPTVTSACDTGLLLCALSRASRRSLGFPRPRESAASPGAFPSVPSHRGLLLSACPGSPIPFSSGTRGAG